VRRAWMPLYCGDLIADTQDLSTLQFGAYLKLIIHYWVHGGLTGDVCQLCNISGLSPQEWRWHHAAIKAKFYMVFDDAWFHKRIEVELQHADDVSKSRKASSLRGVAARQPNGQPNGQPGVNHARASSPSQRKKDKKPIPIGIVKKTRPKTEIDVQESMHLADLSFADEAGLSVSQTQSEWAQFCDHHLKNRSLFADWRAAWRTWVRNVGKFQPNGSHGRSNGNEGFVKSVLKDIENDKRRREESDSKIVPMLQLDGKRH